MRVAKLLFLIAVSALAITELSSSFTDNYDFHLALYAQLVESEMFKIRAAVKTFNKE